MCMKDAEDAVNDISQLLLFSHNLLILLAELPCAFFIFFPHCLELGAGDCVRIA